MGLYGIFMLTCWKPSKLPLRPTSFGELSLATSVHSLPSDFQKTPRANMRIIIGRGSGLGLGWYPYVAKIFPLKKRAAQEEAKENRDSHHRREGHYPVPGKFTQDQICSTKQ